MPLPMSKSALDRLGARLAAEGQASDEDLDQLAEVLRVYQVVLDNVKIQLAGLGFAPTMRVKTIGTLIDKLRRERDMLMSRVQDLAGARIVVANVPDQDGARDGICAHFTAAGHRCRVRDRREEPSYGYRAVHVIIQVEGIPVEIQIRTELQDSWAQIVERMADSWGRGIRYGEDPDPDVFGLPVTDEPHSAIKLLMSLSKLIEQSEDLHRTAGDLQADMERIGLTEEGLQALPDQAFAEEGRRMLQTLGRLQARVYTNDQELRDLLITVGDISTRLSILASDRQGG
jgi:ppGpp synthetase/RelA/SpoT-type nucleotidyltranferase